MLSFGQPGSTVGYVNMNICLHIRNLVHACLAHNIKCAFYVSECTVKRLWSFKTGCRPKEIADYKLNFQSCINLHRFVTNLRIIPFYGLHWLATNNVYFDSQTLVDSEA